MRGLVLLGMLVGHVAFAVTAAGTTERLDGSPRHQEWLVVKSGDHSVHAFIAYPETKEKATAVLVIHENKGLTDWVRGVVDQLAEAGYIAIAPDLLSGLAPGGGRTSDFGSPDAATRAIYELTPERVMADLAAVADTVVKLPSANGKLAVAGFCWGGAQSFRFATARPDLRAAFVFYGSPPDKAEDLARIACPVYGFYGGSDARINATLPETIERMRQAGKTFEPVTYDGAGHGFMRSGEDPEGSEANRAARIAAWERWRRLLKGL